MSGRARLTGRARTPGAPHRVAGLDVKKGRLGEESGRWLAPLADALVGTTPRRPRLRWPLHEVGGLLVGGAKPAGRGRAMVEPLLTASTATTADMVRLGEPTVGGAGGEYRPPAHG